MCGEGAAEKNRGQYWLRCCTDISKWQFLDDIFGMVCWKTIGNTSILHVWIWDNTVNIVLCTCCIIYYDVPLLGFIFIYFFQSFVPSTLWFFLSFFFVRNFSCDAITSLLGMRCFWTLDIVDSFQMGENISQVCNFLETKAQPDFPEGKKKKYLKAKTSDTTMLYPGPFPICVSYIS